MPSIDIPLMLYVKEPFKRVLEKNHEEAIHYGKSQNASYG
jgi:hypothetical protein